MTTRTRTRIAAGAGAVALAAAMTVVGTAPAHAHTGSLFTQSIVGEGVANFATISTADATVTPLPTAVNVFAAGLEIWNEQGYAIGGPGEGADNLYFWDHNTGAITQELPLTLAVGWGDLDSVNSLDTTKGSVLPDGTLLTIVEFEVGEEAVELWIASIDPATGIITPLVNFSDVEGDIILDSLATDPTTGITWAFVDGEGPQSAYPIDFTAMTYGDPVSMEGLWDSVGSGYISGADFNDAGQLWFIYNFEGRALVSLDGAVATEATGTVAGPVEDVAGYALAWDSAPQLAATGLELVNPAIVALGLLVAGGAVVLVTRRRTAV